MMISSAVPRLQTLPVSGPRCAQPTTPAADSVELSAASAPAPPSATAVATASAGTALQLATLGVGHAIGRGISKLYSGARFMLYGTIFKGDEKFTKLREDVHKPLQGLPVPVIKRPFVLVPGWTTEPEAFIPLTNYLTRGGVNGGQAFYVQQGAFYTRNAAGQLTPAAAVQKDAKVFEMVFSDNHQSPNHNVVEMRANFDAILKATGADQVDAEGFSMGGLDSRLYLDQGGKAIHRLLLLGTPNRGTQFGILAGDIIDKNVGWAKKFGGILDKDRESLHWLSYEEKSPQLRDLNSRWDDQRKAATIITVGADVMPTASRTRVTGLSWGDGLVPAHSLELPNSNTIIIHEAMQHGRLNDDETVQHIRAAYFDWDLPANSDDLFPEWDQPYLDRVPPPDPPKAAAAVLPGETGAL